MYVAICCKAIWSLLGHLLVLQEATAPTYFDVNMCLVCMQETGYMQLALYYRDELRNSETAFPTWLHDTFLRHGSCVFVLHTNESGLWHAGNELVHVIGFLLQMGFRKVGVPFLLGEMNPLQKAMAAHLAQLGLLFPFRFVCLALL